MAMYLVRSLEEAAEVIRSQQGESMRIITYKDTPAINIHLSHILDSMRHYHKRSTEVYHILEGKGSMEIDDDLVNLEPGMTILVPPGVRHRAYGDFRTVIAATPAQTPEDFYTDQ
jgi:mannose-6-phosphate isomerase-like protein (cupin superfamily)